MTRNELLSLAERGAWYKWQEALESRDKATMRNNKEDFKYWTLIANYAHSQLREIQRLIKEEVESTN